MDKKTLTEAQTREGYLMIVLDDSGRSSNFRRVPYSERYRAGNGVVETPVEHLQQAARDEAERQQASQAS